MGDLLDRQPVEVTARQPVEVFTRALDRGVHEARLFRLREDRDGVCPGAVETGLDGFASEQRQSVLQLSRRACRSSR